MPFLFPHTKSFNFFKISIFPQNQLFFANFWKLVTVKQKYLEVAESSESNNLWCCSTEWGKCNDIKMGRLSLLSFEIEKSSEKFDSKIFEK